MREISSEEYIKHDIIEQFINRSGNIVYDKTKDRTSVARMNKSCEPVFSCKAAVIRMALGLENHNVWRIKIVVSIEMAFKKLYKAMQDFFWLE